MQNRQLPRPASAPLPLEDLQGMAEEIQSALSFASRLCFDDEGEEEDKFVAREDVRLLYAKLGCISSNWQQLMRASDLHQQQSRVHVSDLLSLSLRTLTPALTVLPHYFPPSFVHEVIRRGGASQSGRRGGNISEAKEAPRGHIHVSSRTPRLDRRQSA